MEKLKEIKMIGDKEENVSKKVDKPKKNEDDDDEDDVIDPEDKLF